MAALVLGDFANALMEVSRVGTFGANKYSKHGWVTTPDGECEYDNAKVRHWLKRKSGEIYDSESGLLHAAHEAWNALAVLEFIIKRMQQERMAEVVRQVHVDHGE